MDIYVFCALAKSISIISIKRGIYFVAGYFSDNAEGAIVLKFFDTAERTLRVESHHSIYLAAKLWNVCHIPAVVLHMAIYSI